MEWFLYNDQGSLFEPENYILMAGTPTNFQKGERLYAILARPKGLYPAITEDLKDEILTALMLKSSTETIRLKP